MANRYVSGGKTEYTNKNVGWWERKVYTKNPDDLKITISKIYHRRPDRLAFDLYGSASLSWFVMQYNDILDCTTEFIEGKKITLPTVTRFNAGGM